MRIGIDARELCGHATGVGRYLSGLLSRWSGAAGRGHQFVLYAAEPIAMSLDSRQFPIRVLAGPAGTWWEQARLPRAIADDRIDVWFSPAYTLPLRITIPSVVAIHDLSFVAHPEWFRFKEGIRRRWLTRASAARASAVLTISQFSKHELIDRLDVSPGRIHVIPPGIDSPGTTLERDAAGVPMRQPESVAPRLLYAGSIFNRRHVTDLIRAFAPIARAHPDARLDLVGDNRTYPLENPARAIHVEELGQQVHWHRYVTDQQLAELYRDARAFAFLSEYEGLGLTPLEALAAGLPPVLLDTAVARESCGDAALYVEAGDLKATTAALNVALFDEAARARILAAAPRELAKYSWSAAARDTLSLLERVATSPGEAS
jgi:glycosyltransferase involved in cell wall biosynthesis